MPLPDRRYRGYATPVEIAAAQGLGAAEPYFTNGYTVGYDQSGEVNGDDLSAFVTGSIDPDNGCPR